ncbi:hypothetical protein JHD47_07470 [Sulfurimonas sp. SAG-AH-194-L11]|nr:hypothetical protein [Sulfurimonas sp. SAG-AH-194-L11]MDF1877657.1 hypothetical protein [Sulfurimonas sp. SAG-AH-194-L11]
MFINFMKINKNYLFILLFFYYQPVLKSQEQILEKKSDLYIENGILQFDYTIIPLSGGGSIDLLGTHYLHKLNDWLYLGLGFNAPLFKGNYGGFMTFDLGLHAQHDISDDLYINAGTALGGGGGGSSVAKSSELSGTGGFIKSYIGVGYKITQNLSLGANYNYYKFKNSQINNTQFGVFIQTPTSYITSSYSNSSKPVRPRYNYPSKDDSMFTYEMNNIVQINPTGTNKEIINTIAMQYSHFITDNTYLFLALEVGYKGRPLYNQFIHGIGYRSLISSQVNLYSQLGIGSGGYSPNDIDTGPGLLIYPKATLEYSVSKKMGVALSGGYLFAPLGTSKNYTLGLALNYHPNKREKRSSRLDNLTYTGFRVDVFNQTEFDVKINNKKHKNIQLLSVQITNLINDYIYMTIHSNVAYTEFLGYPGYGELLAGVGIQNKYSKSDNFQNFFQVLIGTNVQSMIVKPSIGTNYSINERYAIYGQIGKTLSIGTDKSSSFDANNIGIGITYRFSID